MHSPLAGLAVLVTRPRERAGALIERLEALGARPIACPVIEIQPLPSSGARDARRYDIVIFTSPAAVEHGSDGMDLRGAFEVGGVGPATMAALRERGFGVTVEPVGSNDSEGVLAHPAMAPERVSGRHVLIVRGEGGRGLLGDTLVARGAAVDYAEVYRRARPAGPVPAEAAGCDIITVTSNEGVANLLAMIEPSTRTRLLGRPLVVVSERGATRARGAGFDGPIAVAGGADSESIVTAAEQLAISSSQGKTGSA
ncbi:MAG: uroporphyrinogen-III synthase [Halofilum sp. (in: g-proteobacteria)]